MKKSTSFFLCLIILLAAGGFVFYTGWSQFKVPAESVGILVSKTSGMNDTPITHDTFSWNWEFLLPTNATLMTFSPKPYTFEKIVSGTLPSGKEYERVFGGAADFSYNFVFSITLNCAPQNIMDLAKAKEISSQEDLENYLEHAAKTISIAAANEIVNAIASDSIQSVAQSSAIVERAAKDACKNCALDSITLTSHSFPDIELYKSAKNSYSEYIRSLQEAAAEAAKRDAQDVSRFGSTIQKMESLGETLKKYPELSDIMKNSESALKTLEKIDAME